MFRKETVLAFLTGSISQAYAQKTLAQAAAAPQGTLRKLRPDCFQKDKNYQGDDIRHLRGVLEKEDCRQKCFETEKCVAFVWDEKNNCWLKGKEAFPRDKGFWETSMFAGRLMDCGHCCTETNAKHVQFSNTCIQKVKGVSEDKKKFTDFLLGVLGDKCWELPSVCRTAASEFLGHLIGESACHNRSSCSDRHLPDDDVIYYQKLKEKFECVPVTWTPHAECTGEKWTFQPKNQPKNKPLRRYDQEKCADPDHSGFKWCPLKKHWVEGIVEGQEARACERRVGEPAVSVSRRETESEKPCMLPFKFKGTWYMDCKPTDTVGDDKTWCPTKQSFFKEGPKDGVNWGFCKKIPCSINGSRYSPDMEGQKRSVEIDALACQSRCAKTTDCEYFSFWPDGGCHLSDKDSSLQSDPYVAISGNRKCTVV